MKKISSHVEMQRYPMLDWVRLFLALEVMLYHYLNAVTNHQAFMFVPAVPTFLAISGCVVLQSWDRSRSTWHFWWKRFLRIQPLLFVMFAVTFLLFGSTYFLQTIVTYLTAGYALMAGNGATWSLGAEEVAYVLLMLGVYASYYRKQALIICCLCVFATVSIVLDTSHKGVSPLAWIRGYSELAAAFLFGNLVYLNKGRAIAISQEYGWWLLVPALLHSLIWKTFGFHSHIENASSIFVVCTTLLWAIGAKAPRLRSDFSYSIYLWHGPAITFVLIINHVSGHNNFEYTSLAFTLTLLLSLTSWYLIEKPALSFKDFRLRQPSLTGMTQ